MRTRSLFVEALIAVAVLCLLLLMIFPRFQNAQILAKVAASKKDMAKVIQAMKAYRLDYPSNPLQYVGVLGDSNKSDYQVLATASAQNEPDYFITLKKKSLSAYLPAYPVPQLPVQIEGTPPPNWRPMITVGAHDYRWRIKRQPDREYECALFWFTFYQDLYQSEFLGVSHGPLFAYPHQKDWSNIHAYRQFLFYDPSNGLISPGYLIAESTAPSQPKSDNQPENVPTPVPWSPQKTELTANLSPAPSAAAISDPTELIRFSQNLISTMELAYYCVFSDNFAWNEPAWDLERQKQYRIRAIKGELNNLATVQEIDSYYQSQGKQRMYPTDVTYVWSGDDKQQSGSRAPKGTRYPWESYIDERINGASMATRLNPEKIAYISNIPENRKRFTTIRSFNPLWFVLPFKGQTKADSIIITKQPDGLHRTRWSSKSYLNNPTLFFLIDCLLDPSINFMPRKCLLANPTLNMQIPDTDDRVKMLDAWYVELGDYKVIDGVYFPTHMMVTQWHHRPDLDSVPIYGSKIGYQKGFRIPDILGGEPVPPFDRKWDLTLTSARINQPIDETVFSLEAPEGYTTRRD